MRNKKRDWNWNAKRNFTIVTLSLFMLFVLLGFRWNEVVLDASVFPHVDERYAGSLVRETLSHVVDYDECSTEQSVLQFAARNHMTRSAVSVRVFESFGGNPARRGLVATEKIAENQVRILKLIVRNLMIGVTMASVALNGASLRLPWQELLAVPSNLTFSILSILEDAAPADSDSPYVQIIRNLTLSKTLDEFTALAALLSLEAANRRQATEHHPARHSAPEHASHILTASRSP
jgi:hypothetical protein